jgi:8-oxo-dGTP pyrophosphatase MutT (NUDIX family)
VSLVTWDDIAAALASRPPTRVHEDLDSRAAVAVLLRDGEAGLEILFMRRAEDPRDPWSGHMAFPGGRTEPDDADLQVTAIRETREEIGIDLAEAADYLGPLDEVRAMARMQPLSLAITPFVFRLRAEAAASLGPEVRSLHWLPLDDLLGPGRRSRYEYEHDGVRLEFPCLRVEELVIWGLTYRMFLGLQERFGSPAPAAARERR